MKIDEIEKMWVEDCQINQTDLIGESSNIPKLHAKYFAILNRAGLKLKKYKEDHKTLIREKTEYYNGSMDIMEMKSLGWEPLNKKILRQDMSTYIDSDKDVINLSLRIGYYTQIVKFVEDIIRQINSRNFIIKNMIEWAKFSNGGF